jgi:hypothetical protein
MAINTYNDGVDRSVLDQRIAERIGRSLERSAPSANIVETLAWSILL